MRTCTKCGQSGLVPNEFKEGQGNTCRKCVADYDRKRRIEIQNEGGERHERRKEAMRIANAKRKYGITADDAYVLYDTKLCELCGGINQNGSRLNIDHNHTTNKVRGVLCNRCNRGIGFFLDSPALLIKAAEYLKERD